MPYLESNLFMSPTSTTATATECPFWTERCSWNFSFTVEALLQSQQVGNLAKHRVVLDLGATPSVGGLPAFMELQECNFEFSGQDDFMVDPERVQELFSATASWEI